MSATDRDRLLRRRGKILLAGFMAALVVSGVTAFPLTQEVTWLSQWLGAAPGSRPSDFTGLLGWIVTVRDGLQATSRQYPFLFYGTDWLAFGHLMIAIVFLGPMKDPVRNKWVVQWGMTACACVVPLALICGPIRGIPFAWQLIDCSFGVIGILPLWACLRAIHELERTEVP